MDVTLYLEEAAKLAWRVKHKTQCRMSHADLMSYAVEGLLQAAKRYDPEKNANFMGFAYLRMQGACYDGLRQFAWFSRAARDKGLELVFTTIDRSYEPEGLTGMDLETLRHALRALPKTEQVVLEMRYRHGMSFAEIGEHFSLSKSRMCRVHNHIIKKLRRTVR